jgi:hypothetical protein
MHLHLGCMGFAPSAQPCDTAIGAVHGTPHHRTMKRSIPIDTQPATKQTRKRKKSTPEKRHSAAQHLLRHRSNAAGTAHADIVHEKDRQARQRSRASEENTPPPSQQESTRSDEAMTAIPTVHRPPMTVTTTAALAQQQPPPLAAMRTPVSHQSDAPLPAAMTDSCAMLLISPRRTTAWYSLACKGAVLGIPPPADRVRGTHQSLLLGLTRARSTKRKKP